MIFLLLISLLLNIIFLWVIRNMKKEVDFLDEVRIGYEKKYNSFRIRYTILSKMEDSLSIINNLKILNKPIYIYGNGVIGKKLYDMIMMVSEIKVLGIIEGKNSNQLDGNLDKNAIVIITPVFDYDKIVALLSKYVNKKNILNIDDLFNEWEE